MITTGVLWYLTKREPLLLSGVSGHTRTFPVCPIPLLAFARLLQETFLLPTIHIIKFTRTQQPLEPSKRIGPLAGSVPALQSTLRGAFTSRVGRIPSTSCLQPALTSLLGA